MVGVGLLVADLHPAIPAAAHKALGGSPGDGIAWEALVHPLLEALPQKRAADPPVAIEAPGQHKPFWQQRGSQREEALLP